MDKYTTCLLCPKQVFYNNLAVGSENLSLIEFKERLQCLISQNQLNLQVPENATWETLPVCAGCKDHVRIVWESVKNLISASSAINNDLFNRMMVRDELEKERVNMGIRTDEFIELTDALTKNIVKSLWTSFRPQNGSVTVAASAASGSSVPQNVRSDLPDIPVENGSTFTIDGTEPTGNNLGNLDATETQESGTSTRCDYTKNRKRAHPPSSTNLGVETTQNEARKRNCPVKGKSASSPEASSTVERGIRLLGVAEVQPSTLGPLLAAGSSQGKGSFKNFAKIAETVVVKENTKSVTTRKQRAAGMCQKVTVIPPQQTAPYTSSDETDD